MGINVKQCVSRVRVIPSATFQCESYVSSWRRLATILYIVSAMSHTFITITITIYIKYLNWNRYINCRSSLINMASQQQDRSELDAKARQGETVVPGGTGGKSLEAQEHLAEGFIIYYY